MKMKVYLDNCCYNRPYDDQSQIAVSIEAQAKLHIQNMIRRGEVELATSFILRYEISQSPIEHRKKAITDFIESQSAVHIGVNRRKEVQRKADEIMKTGIKMKDAYHVSCAILTGCDYFLSTDKRLLKYQTSEITILNPTEFVKEVEN